MRVKCYKCHKHSVSLDTDFDKQYPDFAMCDSCIDMDNYLDTQDCIDTWHELRQHGYDSYLPIDEEE